MLKSMDWDLYLLWADYAALEPFGEERADLRMGILASLQANMNRDQKKRSKPFEATDFMPFFKRDQQKPLTGSKWRAFKAKAKAMAKRATDALTKGDE